MVDEKKRSVTPRMRPAMATLSDAETTEEARLASMRSEHPAAPERSTMPAPPPAIGRFSIELIAAADVDFKALFERGAYREALTASRERLAVSPADTTALRIAQRSEEALVSEHLRALGGEASVIGLAAFDGARLTVREHTVTSALAGGSLTLGELLSALSLKAIDALDTVRKLQSDGVLLVNLSDQKSTST